ncbi:hypothetical protein G3M48_005460 [Beauveria asiatica]|uniref:DUF4396 domain-containing protein n=1 Tax=Beauveria asiatica TaxID=1069075 RepID=A0AAW0RS99_9HYPO
MNCYTASRSAGRALAVHARTCRAGACFPLLSRPIAHSTSRLDKCCASKKNTVPQGGAQPAPSIGFWSSRATWHRASLNTLRCLVGCTTGDFSAMWLLQTHYPELGMPTIMAISMAAGISTSMVLETVLLRLGRDGLSWPAAAKTAAGMSLISMVTMELAENVVDYSLTGGAVAFDSPAFWLSALVSMGAGFLAPLPYNYHRLRNLHTDYRDIVMNYYTNSAGPAWSAPPQTPPHHVSLRNLEQTLAALQLGDQLVYESQTQSYRFALFRFRRDDGSRIAVKVQQQWPIATHPDNMQNVVRRELYALKKLESIHFKYAPKCIAYDTSFDNPIRMPFLVVTWTEGEPLTWTTHYPPMDMRMRVLNQLFQIQLELIEDSLESCNETARHFYSRLIHDKMMIAPRGPPGIGSIPTQEDYWSQLAQLECVLGPAQDEKTYAIAHNNLVPDNIIVDREHNIEWYNASLHLFHLAHSANVKDSLVGWSFGGLYPLSQAAILPRFLAPAVGIEDAASARQIAHAAVGDKIQYRHPLNVYNMAPTPGRQAMLRWQNGDDADFRALYLLSMKHRDVHAWLARHRWRPPHCQAWQDVGRMPQPQPRPAAPSEHRPEDAAGRLQ